MRESQNLRESGIWVVNPNTSAAITALIDRQVQRALPPGMTACTRHVAWGTPSIETRIDAAIATVALLDLLARDVPAQGVLVAAFGDPGLAAARELIDVPVVGIGEAALAHAAGLGDYAILTIQPASLPLVEDLVRANAGGERCRAIDALPVSVLDAARPQAVYEGLAQAAARLLRDRPLDALVLGGAPLGVHAQALTQQLGVRCIDPVAAGIAQLSARMDEQAAGHRASAYDLLQPKRFSGRFGFLRQLNEALWP